MLAYIHPFMDGNGRVSRALFYWYCLKTGYDTVRYLSISKIIKSHRDGYDLAFLYSEQDGNDVTYFIGYNLDRIAEAIDLFKRYLKRKMDEERKIKDTVRGDGLNERQISVLDFLMKSEDSCDVYQVAQRRMITPETARRDILKLIDLGLVETAGKNGPRYLYRYVDRRAVR